MNALTKVLVVDNGHRSAADMLSTELAELGLSSVTTSMEAAHDVLHVIERPSAIFLNMPTAQDAVARRDFKTLACSLRALASMSGVPIIEWDRATTAGSSAISAILRSEVGPLAVAGPEL